MRKRPPLTHYSVLESSRLRWDLRLGYLAAVLGLALTLAGCSGYSVVSSPNLYVDTKEDPYASVPKELQTSLATILYATDRKSGVTKGVFGYGTQRSREVAFGQCTVALGKNTTWEQLVIASHTRERPSALPLALTSIEEHGHYPALPAMVEVNGRWVEDPVYLESAAKATEDIHHLLDERLARTPTKEVFIFVHGFNNDFSYASFTTAQLWHFLGRTGVPILYSWPAGSGSLLRGYTHDRESGEFTNAHLKQFIRAVASCPQVEKIHLVSHSRGTDVMATALRELHLECRGGGKDTRTELKLGQVILAAPDIDLDVFIERFSADRVGFVPERITIYVSPNDKAIGISGWLFGSARRIGQLAFGDLGRDEAIATKKHPVVNVVDVRAKTIGNGHDYFLSSPEALSDVILVLRDHRAPGAANGRPLLDKEGGFLEIHDGYPSKFQKPQDGTGADQPAGVSLK